MNPGLLRKIQVYPLVISTSVNLILPSNSFYLLVWVKDFWVKAHLTMEIYLQLTPVCEMCILPCPLTNCNFCLFPHTKCWDNLNSHWYQSVTLCLPPHSKSLNFFQKCINQVIYTIWGNPTCPRYWEENWGVTVKGITSSNITINLNHISISCTGKGNYK